MTFTSASRIEPIGDNPVSTATMAEYSLGLFAIASGYDSDQTRLFDNRASEYASQEALLALKDYFIDHCEALAYFQRDPNDASVQAVLALLHQAIQASAYQVFALQDVDPFLKGNNAWLSLILLQNGVAFTANVGFSRVYAIRNNKAVCASNLEISDIGQPQAIGEKDYVCIQERVVHYQTGDVFLLCSKGLYEKLNQPELGRLLLPSDLDHSLYRLAYLALQRGAKEEIGCMAVHVNQD